MPGYVVKGAPHRHGRPPCSLCWSSCPHSLSPGTLVELAHLTPPLSRKPLLTQRLGVGEGQRPLACRVLPSPGTRPLLASLPAGREQEAESACPLLALCDGLDGLGAELRILSLVEALLLLWVFLFFFFPSLGPNPGPFTCQASVPPQVSDTPTLRSPWEGLGSSVPSMVGRGQGLTLASGPVLVTQAHLSSCHVARRGDAWLAGPTFLRVPMGWGPEVLPLGIIRGHGVSRRPRKEGAQQIINPGPVFPGVTHDGALFKTPQHNWGSWGAEGWNCHPPGQHRAGAATDTGWVLRGLSFALG